MTTGSTDDAALWARSVAGDRQALGSLLIRHAERILAAARSAGLSLQDAGDVVQETFVRALSRWEALKDPAALGAWLGQIARNVALDALRRAARRRLPGPPPQEPPPSESGELLSRLDESDSRILRLRYLHGLSGPEIASSLGLPLETVKKRLQRARQAALERLGPEAGR